MSVKNKASTYIKQNCYCIPAFFEWIRLFDDFSCYMLCILNWRNKDYYYYLYRRHLLLHTHDLRYIEAFSSLGYIQPAQMVRQRIRRETHGRTVEQIVVSCHHPGVVRRKRGGTGVAEELVRVDRLRRKIRDEGIRGGEIQVGFVPFEDRRRRRRGGFVSGRLGAFRRLPVRFWRIT